MIFAVFDVWVTARRR